MAVSRPLLLALIGAVLALVAFYATSGGEGSVTDPSKPAGAEAEQRSTPPREDPAASAKPAAEARRAGAPPTSVRRALAGKRTVVLFFFQRGSADDDATAGSVSSLRGRPGVRVFSAPISRIGDYQAVIGGAGVSQAPAVVILGRDRAARLIEGFVDRETLAQQVADAR